MKIKKGGISILGILLLCVIAVLILSFSNTNIRSTVESPQSQDNLHYVGGGVRNLWNDYLKKPADYLWNEIWVKIFWASFVSNMEDIRDKKPTDFEKNAPTYNLSN